MELEKNHTASMPILCELIFTASWNTCFVIENFILGSKLIFKARYGSDFYEADIEVHVLLMVVNRT